MPSPQTMTKQANLRMPDHKFQKPGQSSEEQSDDAKEDAKYKAIDVNKTLYGLERAGERDLALPVAASSPRETASTSYGALCTSGAEMEQSGCGRLPDSYTIVVVIVSQCVHSNVVASTKIESPVLASTTRKRKATQTECNLPYRSAVPGKKYNKTMNDGTSD